MKVTLEISLYPLTERYGDLVISFIGTLKSQPGIQIRTNSMSTQVTGPFADVWEAVKVAVLNTFQDHGDTVSVFKLFNQELDLEWQSI